MFIVIVACLLVIAVIGYYIVAETKKLRQVQAISLRFEAIRNDPMLSVQEKITAGHMLQEELRKLR